MIKSFMNPYKIILQLAIGISTLGTGYYFYTRPKWDGMEIWRHSNSVKGTWQDTYIHAYDTNSHQYTSLHFNDGIKYVPENTINRMHLLNQLERIQASGYQPYSTDDVKKYKYYYGF